jgi:hypothetical protein
VVGEPAAGWFQDPSSRHLVRYWDGSRWTPYVCDPDGHVAEETSIHPNHPAPQQASARPSSLPEPPAPPNGGRDPERSTADLLDPPLTYALQGSLVASAATFAVAAALSARALEVALPRGAGLDAYLRWENADNNILAVSVLVCIPMWLATFTLLLVWTAMAHRASEVFVPGWRRWGAGWALGGWFIPFAQFVVPKLVLGEVERIASAPRSGGRVDAVWRQRSSGALGWLWWLSLCLSNVLLGISFWGRIRNDQIEVSPAVFRSTYRFATLGYTLLAASNLIAVLYVGVLGAQLHRHTDRRPARSQRVQTGEKRK